MNPVRLMSAALFALVVANFLVGGAPSAVETPELSQSAEELRAACADGDGDGRACNALGRRHSQGQGVPEDHERAAQLYREACNAGMARGCINLAQHYEATDSAAADQAVVIELYERACFAGGGVGCMRLAARADRGDGLHRDARRALRLYQRACIVGRVARACERAGAMALGGRGAPPDEVAAFDSFTWGCEDGSAEACVRLGSMQLEGRVPVYRPQAIAPRREAAARAFQQACTAGSEDGCAKLADLFDETG